MDSHLLQKDIKYLSTLKAKLFTITGINFFHKNAFSQISMKNIRFIK